MHQELPASNVSVTDLEEATRQAYLKTDSDFVALGVRDGACVVTGMHLTLVCSIASYNGIRPVHDVGISIGVCVCLSSFPCPLGMPDSDMESQPPCHLLLVYSGRDTRTHSSCKCRGLASSACRVAISRCAARWRGIGGADDAGDNLRDSK
jgi:hypothetical protein